MKAGPRNGTSARMPRVRPSIEARAAAWTATVRGDAAPAVEDAARGPASCTPGGRRRRRAIGPRLDLDPAGERVADDALARADAQRQGAGERLPRAVVGRIAEEARHALLEGV